MPPSEPAPGEPDRFERELSTDLKDSTPDLPRGLPLHTRILLGLVVGVVAGLVANVAWGATTHACPGSSPTSPNPWARCSCAPCS